MPANNFREAKLWSAPIQSLGLAIAGTPLESIVAEFETELDRVNIRRLRPRFYLSTEWGVPFGTIAIAIPFYLAQPDLTTLHVQRLGLAEGSNRGIEYALARGASHVALVNDDMRLHRRWLRELLDESSRTPSSGVLGGLILFSDRPDAINSTGLVSVSVRQSSDSGPIG